MGKLIELQVTIFSLVLVGAIMKRLGIVDGKGQKSLTDLVIDLILPCNIITSFTATLPDTALKDCFQILLISCGIQIMSVFYGKFLARGENEDRAMSIRYSTITSNAGFLGNPIAEGLYGAMGLVLASVFLIPQRIMMWSEGIAIYSGISDKKQMFKKVLTHPCVIACIVGVIILIGKIRLLGLILSPIQTLGKCNTGLSMLVIGMILAEMDPKKMLDRTAIQFTVHRLVIIPAIVFLVCRLLPVSQIVCGSSTILTAMPAGVTTSMLALKYDRDPEFATTVVILSTLCSIPTICLWSLLI